MASQKNSVELRGSARSLPAGAKQVGPANPQDKIEVTVRLRRGSATDAFQTNAAAAGSSATQSNAASKDLTQRTYLKREEFAANHGASAGDVAAIRAFANENNLTVTEEDRARRTVKLSGTVEALSNAFGVTLNRAELNGEQVRLRTGSIQIPQNLANVIEAVLGLDNRPQAKPHFRRKKHQNPANISYSAVQVATAYNFPANTDGTGQAIAILELGGGYKTADLNSYFKSLNIATPNVNAISVDGATNAPTGSADGPDGEVELDIEVAGAVAPQAKIGVYFAPNTDQGFVDALTTAIHDMTLKPTIVSISWGGPESSWTAQARNTLNSACEDAATMGVTVLVASGDNGATDGVSGNALTVDFPASSPFVTGCGGTTLRLSGSSIATETVWNETANNEGATGGGVSEVFALPTFQNGVSVPQAPNGIAGRGVPDVAGDADPSTGFNVIVDGAPNVIGGTSAVAPLWAGLVARLNQSLGKPVGYLNPLIYAASEEATFHDITSGNNNGYTAKAGWDPCTGLGSPNGTKLLAALKSASAANR